VHDHRVELTLDRDPAEVHTARHAVQETLEDWGVEHLAADGVIVVSELVTNALLHGAGQPELTISCSDAGVRLAVSDAGGDPPEPRLPSPNEPSGRGLLIVERLGRRWGWNRCPRGGKTVWVELAEPA
jgi:anti-sigma regulatory factor (Ser/Thr protein kinase)